MSCKIVFYKLNSAWFSAADCISVCYFTIINGAYSQCIIRPCSLELLPRLELGSLDSKSKVLTITPQNQLLINSAAKIPAQVRNFEVALYVRGRLRSLKILF